MELSEILKWFFPGWLFGFLGVLICSAISYVVLLFKNITNK